MYIRKIKEIENYRNLSGVDFSFTKKINFIVGENNIGKTNVMELMNKVVKIGKFEESDFTDVREPIKIIFSIKYSESELGFFESTFDVNDEYLITITATQESVDSRIEYVHTGSESYINPKHIKMLNFIYYSSLRTPNKELSFNNNIGTGKVLKYIMKKSLEDKDIQQMDLLKQDEIREVLTEVNGRLDKLNGLSSEKIEAFLSEDNENIINRILEIGDINKRNLSKLGDGLQYSFNIFLNILDLLVHLKTTKKENVFESLLIKEADGKKYLPIILGLDEPEIHQHPYRQRALIKSIRDIISNKNEGFTQIINDLFDIDGFIGQVFVTTHSPSILLDDYRQIIRLYKEGDNVSSSSGNAIQFTPDEKKLLRSSFMYFKEAMFAKAVILVEGDTEYGAVPVFAQRLDFDMDEKSVGVFKLDGADGVKKYLKLFDGYSIEAKAILDKDKEADYTGHDQISFTTGIDFEEDIFDNFTFDGYLEYLVSLNKHTCLIRLLRAKIDDFDRREFLEDPCSYEVENEVKIEIMAEIREKELEELGKQKNAVHGALLAELVDEIPQAFEDIITDIMWEI
ncbi:AAA family ATPase [Vallitaleaceae bacterium 9-2]